MERLTMHWVVRRISTRVLTLTTATRHSITETQHHLQSKF